MSKKLRNKKVIITLVVVIVIVLIACALAAQSGLTLRDIMLRIHGLR